MRPLTEPYDRLDDAAVAVTRGALETLDRNELQGVIAHEFSHIFNGDMRLNIRLMGVLFGIVCIATIGQVGNTDHSNIKIGKAGRSRWLGIRPQTRGTAMNPVDHPHGGGEGRNKGRHPVSPWGWPTKGAKTRRAKASDRLIVSRRKK